MWAEAAATAITFGSVATGLIQRRRVRALAVLASAEVDEASVRFITADGVTLDRATRRQAAHHLAERGLDVLDLVPASTSTAGWTRWLEAVDPSAPPNDYVRRVSAGHALAVSARVADAMEALPSTCERTELLRLYRRLARQAPASTSMALATRLPATNDPPEARAELHRLQLGLAQPLTLVLQATVFALLALTLVGSPWGLMALAAWQLRPALGLAGTSARPPDLARACLLRPLLAPRSWWREVWAIDARHTARVEALRPHYQALIDAGIPHQRKPRRPTCPVCESDRLHVHLLTTDLLQGKPGRFVLERCDACRHVFQNPPLSPDALAFFYRDFYDGLFEEQAEEGFLSTGPLYPGRAAAVEGLVTPASWLDVGAGHGHLALALRRQWPGLKIEGIDLSDSVVAAQARGWLDQGWRGTLEAHGPSLEGRFDVASLFHCLEHVPDQAAELRAVAATVKPGGHVIVEVPNPDFRFAALMGRYWFPWFQPQHQHLLRLDGLRTLARGAGLEIVRTQFLTTAGDFFLAAALFVGARLPGADVPWKPAPSRLARALTVPLGVLVLPVFVGAMLADAMAGRWPAGLRNSNAYRVVARKEEAVEADAPAQG